MKSQKHLILSIAMLVLVNCKGQESKKTNDHKKVSVRRTTSCKKLKII